MRHIIVAILALCLPMSDAQILVPIVGDVHHGGFAPFDKGINFRNTSGYVTDGAGFTYSIGAVYPETRNGTTFGFSADLSSGGAGNCRDRSTTVDSAGGHRLAGLCFDTQNQVVYFRLDLPAAGTYTFYAAFGDQDCNSNDQKVVIKDTTTTLSTLTVAAVSCMMDATGTKYSNADWITMETPISLTFATTQLRIYLGDGTNPGKIASIRVVRTA